MRAIIALCVVPWVIGCGDVVKGGGTDVVIEPHAPTTVDDLVATTSASGATFTWMKNGVVRTDVNGDTVNASVTTRGELWHVDMTIGGKVVGSDEVTIVNSAPTAPDVSLSNPTPSPNHRLQCLLATAVTDPDGDPVTTTFSWTKNGTAYTTATMTTLPGDTVAAADVAEGDVFVCTVKASDGMADAMGTAASQAALCVHGTQMFSINGTQQTGTLQTFSVPAGVCSLTIEAAGALGGPGATNGAIMIGKFDLPAATQLSILVGQKATSYAGGGGSFVIGPGSQPLVIAGGGGSNTAGTANPAESQGRITTSGGTFGVAGRADNGNGGVIIAGANTGAGGGFNGNGQGAGFGHAYVAGGAGGFVASEAAFGGYGGGGGRGGLWGEGGGGGYSGGSCGNTFTAPSTGTWVGCGGGGSINMGTNQVNTAGANATDGYVKLTW